jgi:tyrosine decarboxylase
LSGDFRDIKALFLGPKAENGKFFEDMLSYLIGDHMSWRRYFHPDDPPSVSAEDLSDKGYRNTLQRTRETLVELAARLQEGSMPWFSPRYLGHMNADTLMSASLAYMLTILYNPNNCAYEGSPATTPLEIEVGRQLAALMGYDPARAWGHITSGGTIANYEGLWVARNLKSVPMALKHVMPGLVSGLDDRQLRNMKHDAILDLLDAVRAEGLTDELLGATVRGVGMTPLGSGKLLVPCTKHYSWTKAADILGIGRRNLVHVRVRDDYRMDTEDLRRTLLGLADAGEAVLAVVAVAGTTEEGAVDEIHEIVRIRRELEDRGLSFHLHADAAYGGYARSVFLDGEGRFMEAEEIRHSLRESGITGSESSWPSPDVHEAFRAFPEAESITVDPHKLGYVPYAAGAILMRDRRVLDLVSYFASYVFEKGEDTPVLLGSHIMEGSKAGAVAAAVWVAHQVCPLNMEGYGRLIGSSIGGAAAFHGALLEAGPQEVGGKVFRIRPLTAPDLNVVVFALNEEGNADLGAMNRLNRALYEQCSYRSGPVYTSDFLVSKTSLGREEYGEAPIPLLESLGIPTEQWTGKTEVFVLRSCVLTPLLSEGEGGAAYAEQLLGTIWTKLEKALETL